MKIDIYKKLTYDENERKRIPYAYSDGGKGNRRCQYIKITDKTIVGNFLKRYNLEGKRDDAISISVLWNLPRLEYSENDMWVCVSGFTYGKDNLRPKHFVISDNIVSEESQNRAMEMLEFLNTCASLEVSYPTI